MLTMRIVLHFDDEIEYFWVKFFIIFFECLIYLLTVHVHFQKKRWSPGKFLFLWVSYTAFPQLIYIS